MTSLGGEEIHDNSHEKHSDCVARIIVLQMPFEEILSAVDGLYECGGSAAQNHTEARVAEEHKRILRVKVRHPEARDHERGLTTKEELTDVRGRGRGDGDRNDGTDAYLVKYELQGRRGFPLWGC